MEKGQIKIRRLILIGGSAGGLEVILELLPKIHLDRYTVIVIVLHRASTSDSNLLNLLRTKTRIDIREVEDKDAINGGTIFIAPAGYHLLFEKNLYFSLDASEKINFSRPSIDVCFESAADVFKEKVTAILLSGSNTDGTNGLLSVKGNGGYCIVQDPESAQMSFMPQNALDNCEIDAVMSSEKMAEYINKCHA
jgi:two-component system, chemotaxis family, protein-glutamate methylesterase/glutaminase